MQLHLSRCSAALLSVVIVVGAGMTASSSIAQAQAVEAEEDRRFGLPSFGLFSDQDSKETKSVPVPPGELTNSSNAAGVGNAPIVVAQSRRELGQGLAQNNLRVDQLEEQVRRLTGRLEEMMFQMQQLQEQLRLMQEDNEFRFQELEGGRRSSVEPADRERTRDTAQGIPSEATEGGDDTFLLPPQDQELAGAGVTEAPLDLGANIRTNPDIVSDGVTQNVGDAASTLGDSAALPDSQDPLLRPGGEATIGSLTLPPVDSPRALYDLGYSQIVNGDYEGAEQTFKAFMAQFPGHELFPNAQFWLGESYFVRGRYDDAILHFSDGYTAHPNSSKAPDSLLKLGISLAAIQQTDAACATLAEMLERFPNASRSIQLAARNEQSRSNCI